MNFGGGGGPPAYPFALLRKIEKSENCLRKQRSYISDISQLMAIDFI